MRVAVSLLIAVLIVAPCRAALIPPSFSQAVVAIGFVKTTMETGKLPVSEWVTVGTGFFYGAQIKDDPDPTKQQFETYLVTARHVVEPHIREKTRDLQIRINPKVSSDRVREITLPTNPAPGESTWFYHPDKDIDLAIIRLNMNPLFDQGFEATFFSDKLHAATVAKMKELEVSAGDGVFVLGFPLNLSGIDRSYIIVRQGIIARVNELLNGASRSFMLDSFAFPGNSGGPVVLKPEITAIEGTKVNSKAYLIGVLTEYRSYNDVAVSQQTGQPRIVFQENSGLANVLPVDNIDAAIVAWRKAHPVTALPPPPQLLTPPSTK